MNQAQEMFSAFIRPFTRRSGSERQTHNSNPTGNRQAQDNEEDGFLLVGQSRSERTTVKACDFSGNINPPPDYNSVSKNPKVEDGLPTYTEYCRSISSSSAEMDVSLHTDFNQNSFTCNNFGNDSFSNKTVIADVPFVLNPQLQTVVDLLHGSTLSLPNRHTNISSSQYDYDFSVENSVIDESFT